MMPQWFYLEIKKFVCDSKSRGYTATELGGGVEEFRFPPPSGQGVSAVVRAICVLIHIPYAKKIQAY